jgi:hypothetical protein
VKKIILAFIIISVFALYSFTSCKKELAQVTTPQHPSGKKPIAIAGFDQTITLPVDSVVLDVRSSYDWDGKIVSYLRTKISGSSSFHILTPSSQKDLFSFHRQW